MAENETAWNIFCLLSTQLRTAGLGDIVGFDIASLKFLFEVYDVPRSEWRFVLDKVNILVKTATKFMRSKAEQRKAADEAKKRAASKK